LEIRFLLDYFLVNTTSGLRYSYL